MRGANCWAFCLTWLIAVSLGGAATACRGDHRPGDQSAASGCGGRHHRRRLAKADPQPTSRGCIISKADASALASAVPQLENRVYGATTAGMPSARLQQAIQDSAFPNAGITVDVHYHVITHKGLPSLTDRTTNVTRADLAVQTAVLNADYSASGLRFRLASLTRHDRRAWARDCSGMASQIAKAVVVDPATALNVIVCDSYQTAGNLGFAFGLPWPGFNQNSRAQAVVMDYKTVPGGPYDWYSGGRTLTHEVGHWAGLAHTFSDSCEDAGDGVADTPQQWGASNGCPVGKDSCPGQPGADAVANFMDYSQDSCMEQFSLGQVARMQAVLLQYRPALVAAASNRFRPKRLAQAVPSRRRPPTAKNRSSVSRRGQLPPN